MRTILTLTVLIGLTISCHNLNSSKMAEQPLVETSDIITTVTKLEKTQCKDLNDKQKIFQLAKALIQRNDNKDEWNLWEIDTTKFLTVEDHFTSPNTLQKIILIGGMAGMSSGSANNLLMLYDCKDSASLLWYGQSEYITTEGIQDVNHDGIKEIITKGSSVWMGQCNDTYRIRNFKGVKENTLFSSESFSVMDCGGTLSDNYNIGDTLAIEKSFKLMDGKGGTFYIQQIKTVKVHNGGATDEDIVSKAALYRDTTLITLN